MIENEESMIKTTINQNGVTPIAAHSARDESGFFATRTPMSIAYADFKRQVGPLDLIGIHGNRVASYAIELAEFFGSGNGKCVNMDILHDKNETVS